MKRQHQTSDSRTKAEGYCRISEEHENGSRGFDWNLGEAYKLSHIRRSGGWDLPMCPLGAQWECSARVHRQRDSSRTPALTQGKQQRAWTGSAVQEVGNKTPGKGLEDMRRRSIIFWHIHWILHCKPLYGPLWNVILVRKQRKSG